MPATELPQPPAAEAPAAAPEVPQPAEGFKDGAPPVQEGDPDPFKANRFSIEEPGLMARLAELRKEIATGKTEPEIKPVAQSAEREEPKPVVTKKPESTKADEVEITEDSSDDALDAHVKRNSKNLSPVQLDHFKKQTYAIREFKRQLKSKDSLETELKDLREKANNQGAVDAVQKELESSKKRIEDQEKELAATRWESSDTYRKQIAEPMADIEKRFQSVAAEYEIAPDDIMKTAAMKGKARAAALAELTLEMPEYDKIKFYNLIDKHTELSAQASDMRANAKTHYDQWLQAQRETEDRAAAEHRSKYTTAIDKTWKESIEKFAPYIKEQENDEDWNGRLKYAKDWAGAVDLRELPPETVAEVTNRAATWPLLAGRVNTLEAEKAKLEQRIAQLTKARPSAGNSRVQATPAPAKDDEKDTLMSRFAKMQRNLGS